MYESFLAILISLVLVGLIFFIITNAFSTRNFKMRALIYFLVSTILLIGCIGAYFYDVNTGEEIKLINYIIFPGSIILVSGILIVINLFKAKKHHHHLRGYRHRQADDLEQYLYIVFKVNNIYYLKTVDGKYRGEIIKFYRNVFFHDEMMNKVIEKLELEPIKAKFIGMVEQNLKKKLQYFCYLVDLNKFNLDGYNEINEFEIGEINTEEMDKQIILRIVIGDDFNIKV